ncbi:MAG: DUF222 domain-containing protein [Aquihabitans sp.]
MTADLRVSALQCAASVDPDVMTGAQAAAAVADLATVEKAAATARMFLALRVAKTSAWQGQGHKTAADWLAGQLGISVWEANKQLGTARKAEGLPGTKDAMKKGKLSPDQADAVADAATADPSAEQDLLDLAERETTKNLRDEAAKRKAAATDDEARDRRLHRERSLRRYRDRDGGSNLHLRTTPAVSARIEALLRPAEEQIFRTARSAGTDGVRDTFENRAHDAFLQLLGLGPDQPDTAAPSDRSTGDAGPTDGPGTEPCPAPAPVKRAGGSNIKVIVRIDHTALIRGRTVAGETCDIAGLGPISVAAAKDLMGDAFLAAVVMNGRDVVNVAHLGRGPSAHQRTALEAAGVACTNICCNRTVNIEADHRTPYADRPETRLDNLDWLCRGNGGCHDLKTHHGHQLEPGTGRRRLLPPDHPDHPNNRQASETDPSPPAQIEQPTLC